MKLETLVQQLQTTDTSQEIELIQQAPMTIVYTDQINTTLPIKEIWIVYKSKQ